LVLLKYGHEEMPLSKYFLDGTPLERYPLQLKEKRYDILPG
jgi:hypothetical protein